MFIYHNILSPMLEITYNSILWISPMLLYKPLSTAYALQPTLAVKV